MTGNTITKSSTSVTANVENVFSNLQLVVDIGGEKFDAKVAKVASKVATGTYQG